MTPNIDLLREICDVCDFQPKTFLSDKYNQSDLDTLEEHKYIKEIVSMRFKMHKLQNLGIETIKSFSNE